jgi:hypothetical protein
VTAALPAFTPVAVSFAVVLPPSETTPAGLAPQATGRGTEFPFEQTAVRPAEPPTLIVFGVAVTERDGQAEGDEHDGTISYLMEQLLV